MSDYTKIELIFPDTIHFTTAQLQDLAMLNEGVKLHWKEKILHIEEGFLHFSEAFFLALKLPFEITEEQFEQIEELNQYEYSKLEYNPDIIFINMGIVALIAAFTILISTTIVNWNRKQKTGKAFDAQGRYVLTK